MNYPTIFLIGTATGMGVSYIVMKMTEGLNGKHLEKDVKEDFCPFLEKCNPTYTELTNYCLIRYYECSRGKDERNNKLVE
jgi:hypothetical protein